ncbi:hypothetical protein ACI8AG_10200 [Blastococcus sp. SYSU DS0552]
MKKSAAVLAMTTSLLGGLVIMAPQAGAIGGNCSAWAEKRVVDWAPDDWRVLARCSYLQADTKARGVGDVDGPDHHTAWFTAINTTRASSWGKGGIDRTRVEMTHI